MALTDQPYLPLYVDDWMNNTKLKMCSPSAHGLMISIMCLMHKSDSYGVILLKQKFKQNDSQIKNFALQIAKTTSFDLVEIEPNLTELLNENVLHITGNSLICNRMVKDADISLKRSKVGSEGGKSTQRNKKEFAKAKNEANPVIVNGIVSESVNDNEIPNWETFLLFAKEKESSVNVAALKNKYDAWVVNGWKDGNSNKIKNWKSKLLQTMPYINKDIEGQKFKVVYKSAMGKDTYFHTDQEIIKKTESGYFVLESKEAY